MLSVQWSMTIFVLNFGGQLVYLDMATWFWTSSRRRPGFDPGHPNGFLCYIRYISLVDWPQMKWQQFAIYSILYCTLVNTIYIMAIDSQLTQASSIILSLLCSMFGLYKFIGYLFPSCKKRWFYDIDRIQF